MNKDELVYECFIMRQYDPDFNRADDKLYLAKLQAMRDIELEEHLLFLEANKIRNLVVA